MYSVWHIFYIIYKVYYVVKDALQYMNCMYLNKEHLNMIHINTADRSVNLKCLLIMQFNSFFLLLSKFKSVREILKYLYRIIDMLKIESFDNSDMYL